MPRISIVIPMYNANRTIGRAIESVLQQSLSDWELLIIDDASTDGAIEALREKYSADTRIQMLSLPVNSGPSAARNAGFARATGTWLAILDADDAWRSDRLETLLKNAEGSDVVADNIITYDATANEETGLLFNVTERSALRLSSLLSDQLGENLINAGLLKPIIRRDFLVRHGIVYDEGLRFSEDMILYCEALCSGANFQVLTYAGYIYTMWRGLKSRTLSAYSNTHPNSREVSERMGRIVDRYADRLTAREIKLFRHKIAELRVIDEWYQFRSAMNRRQVEAAMRWAFTSRYVRFRVVRALRRRLGLHSGSWGEMLDRC